MTLPAPAYPYKMPPMAHQREILRATATQPFWAWFMEQGTGKTFVALHNMAFLASKGKIDGAVVVAPNGVHDNWATDEIPKHWPDSLVPIRVWVWESDRAAGVKYREAFKAAVDAPGFLLLAINVQAIITKWGKKACLRMLMRRRCMMAVDESTDIKAAGSKVSRTAQTLGRRAPYRRILNGTPAGDGNPLDYYGQMRFLNVRILGINTYSQYKELVAEWEEREDAARGHQYKVIARDAQGRPKWKNLDLVKSRVDRFSSRVLKKDCLDIPDKTYGKRYVYLSPEQRKLYDELEENYMFELQGQLVTAELSMVRLGKLQQIACGYVRAEADEPYLFIPGPKPRIDAMLDFAHECQDHPFIIWAKYQNDVTLIIQELRMAGISCGRYDGVADEDERTRTKQEFQSGHLQAFVGNTASGGRGLTLTQAQAMLFYSNYHKLQSRVQGEDRAHRYGTTKLYIEDLVAKNTVDQKIVRALRNKQDVADTLTGDPKKDWI